MDLKKRGGTVPNTIDATSPKMAGRKSGPGQRNKLPSETITHDFWASRPRWLLSGAGISTASLSCGAVWGDRQDGHERLYDFILVNHEHYCARTIFHAFFAASCGFTLPQIGIADDQARNRRGPCHGFQSFSISLRCSCPAGISDLETRSIICWRCASLILPT